MEVMMQVFVTGGTGFVGSHMLKQLTAARHQVVALGRPGSEDKLIHADNIAVHPGDATDPHSL
jgi:NADH dehydrogenase